MPTIRHEINIIDYTLTTTGVVTLDGKIQLDTTKYVNPTYYFEIDVGTIGANSSYSLNRTATSDATINVTATTDNNKRLRSSSFTPPTGQTEYWVNKAISASNNTIKAARIVIIDNPTTLTSSQTQIEIGDNQGSLTATTATALTNTKYWKYTAANWDGTKTFYAEATYAVSSSKSTITITLQEDNGSFGAWADKVTIVSGGTATLATRVRSAAFTPTDGRNYRLAYLVSSSKSSSTIYNGKIIIDQGAAPNSQAATDATTVPSGYGFYNGVHYANGRLWVFYSDGTDFVYRSRANPQFSSSWSAKATAVSGMTSGVFVSVCLDAAGYFHFAYMSGTANTAGNNLMYKRGLANSDGTITFDTAVSAYTDGTWGVASDPISIVTDYQNKPWIGFRVAQAGPIVVPKLAASTATDGTWSARSGYPVDLQAQNANGVHGEGLSVTEIADGVIYAIWRDNINNRMSADTSTAGAVPTGTLEATGVAISGTLVDVVKIASGACLISSGTTVRKRTSGAVYSDVNPTGASAVSYNGLTATVSGGTYTVRHWDFSGTTVRYRQTTDGGTTWSGNVTFYTAAATINNFQPSYSPNANAHFLVSRESTANLIVASDGIDLGDRVTKLEEQYLLLNTADDNTTNNQNYMTLWDSTEWSGVTNTYYHAMDSNNASNSADLVDVDNSSTQVTNSSVTGANQQISSALTMPTTGHQIDTDIDNTTGVIAASRILAVVWKTPSVSDSITVTESVSVSLETPSGDLTVNKSDSISVSESTIQLITSFINVNESISVSESVTPVVVSFINVSDSISTAESVKLLVVSFVNVSDSISVTENVQTSEVPNPSVSESITVSESVKLEVSSFINVSDSISVSENTVELITSFVSVSDSISVSESVEALQVYLVNVNDSISVSESTLQLLTSFINVSDSISLSEAISLLPIGYIAVSDSVSVSENVQLDVLSFINVSDSISVTENAVTYLTSFVSVSDSITLSESVETSGVPNPNVNDTVTVNESVMLNPTDFPAVMDSISVTENLLLELAPPEAKVSDSISVSESTNQEITSYIASSDNISVSENINATLVNLVNVNDSISVSESAAVYAGVEVNVSETISVSESVNLLITSYVNVSDSVSLSESVQLNAVSFVAVSDSISVSESVNALQVYQVNVSDSVQVSEALELVVTSYVAVSDSISVNESLNLLLIGYVAVSESVTISENLAVQIETIAAAQVNVNDSISLSESSTVDLPVNLTLSDSIAVSESIQTSGVPNPSVSNSIAVSENLKLQITSFVNVSDSLSLSESVSVQVSVAPSSLPYARMLMGAGL